MFCSTQCMSVWSKPSWNIFFFLPNWALMEIRCACRIIDLEDTKWVFLLTQTDYISCVFTVSHAKRHKTVSLKANIRWNKIAMLENSTKTSLADDADCFKLLISLHCPQGNMLFIVNVTEWSLLEFLYHFGRSVDWLNLSGSSHPLTPRSFLLFGGPPMSLFCVQKCLI